MASFDLHISMECVDNASGSGGVIVYDNKTFTFSSQQDATEQTASDYSSVQPFQSDHDENDPAVDCEPELGDSNSLASRQEEEEEGGDDGR